jgi:hypothetical protein
MTIDAQQRMIIGAMCIDETFRYELFTPPEPGVEESAYDKVARLLSAYADENHVTVDESVVQHVLNVVRAGSNCRVAALSALAETKAALCPCWPC